MLKNSKIYVTHHHDLIGFSIFEELLQQGFSNIITCDESALDLTSDFAVSQFFKTEKPEYIFCFAGPHGGIIKNTTYPANLIYDNLRIQCNVIHNAYLQGVKKLLFMTGSCLYPKESPQPITEDYYMTGKMEHTSAAYSTARAAGVEMCHAYNKQYNTFFIPAVITNYYGPGDDYTSDGHVLASVMHKMHTAKLNNEATLTLWGTGEPKRQFMFSKDIAAAAILIMNSYESTELINIAGGQEFSISQLAAELKKITEYSGTIIFDTTKPNGTMRKLLDNSKIKGLGFKEMFSFTEGLSLIYQDYLKTNKEDN